MVFLTKSPKTILEECNFCKATLGDNTLFKAATFELIHVARSVRNTWANHDYTITKIVRIESMAQGYSGGHQD